MSKPSAFDRMRRLLHGVTPPDGLDPIPLHLGESRLTPRHLDLTPLNDLDGWTRYPALGGTPELRAAYTGWLERRFGVRRAVEDGRIAVEPTPGTKQAVAVAITLAVARARGEHDPVVIMPNPFYPTYRAAAEAAGARTVFYTIGDTRDAAPIAAAVDAAEGRAAVIIVCNPGNPQGEILLAETLADVAKQAASAGALLIVDECYTDLSFDQVPPGYLTLVEEDLVDPRSFLVLHTLSKRSAAPGLRSGFAVGDSATVTAYAAYNRVCGVSTPSPVNAVAAALWADDGHVREVQAVLARTWDLADTLLAALPGYRRADAGFFLWLPVVDDEETAVRLWRDHALTVMPGRYVAADGQGGLNPEAGHVRVALVHQEPLMREALTRLGHSAGGRSVRVL